MNPRKVTVKFNVDAKCVTVENEGLIVDMGNYDEAPDVVVSRYETPDEVKAWLRTCPSTVELGTKRVTGKPTVKQNDQINRVPENGAQVENVEATGTPVEFLVLQPNPLEPQPFDRSKGPFFDQLMGIQFPEDLLEFPKSNALDRYLWCWKLFCELTDRANAISDRVEKGDESDPTYSSNLYALFVAREGLRAALLQHRQSLSDSLRAKSNTSRIYGKHNCRRQSFSLE